MPLPEGFELDEENTLPPGFELDVEPTSELSADKFPEGNIPPFALEGIPGGSGAAMPSSAIQMLKPTAKGLATNEPVGAAGTMARLAPMLYGGALLGPPGAILGEAGRQALVVGASMAGLTKTPTAMETLTKPIAAGAVEAGGQIGGLGLSKAFSFARQRIPPVYRQIFGVGEEATRRAVEKGPTNILSKETAREDTSLILLDKAREALVSNRQEAGKLIDQAEQAIANTPEGKTLFDVSGLAQKLEAFMKDAGLRGPTEILGNKKIISEFDDIIQLLSSGVASAKDLINMKQLLGQKVTFLKDTLRAIGTREEAMLRGIVNEMSETLANRFPSLKGAYNEFSKAATIYEEYFKTLGGQATENVNILGDVRTLGKIRQSFLRGGKEQELIRQFDDKIAAGENYISQIFDSISAREFNLGAPAQLSPSSIGMRGAAIFGITAPQVGSALLKTGQRTFNLLNPFGQTAGLVGRGITSQLFKDFRRGGR